jgi:hypothetical protein
VYVPTASPPPKAIVRLEGLGKLKEKKSRDIIGSRKYGIPNIM